MSLAALAERAARLCKADLVTGMVGEFPELQGVIGGHLARAQDEPREVWEAVRDHYKPVGQGDEVPTAPVTVAVSLADKLDTVFSFYGVDEPPSGSRDPFALRRAALAIIALLTQNELRLPARATLNALAVFNEEAYARHIARFVNGLDHAIDKWRSARPDNNRLAFDSLRNLSFAAQNATAELTEEGYQDNGRSPVRFEHRDYIHSHLWFGDWDCVPPIADAVIDFLADRLKVQQREAGVRHDLIDAVFALGGEDDLVRLLARVKALQAFVATPDGANLLAGYKRAANILKQAGEVPPAAPPAAMGAIDRALFDAVDHAATQAESDVNREDFAAAMTALASLRAPIDAFFEGVMVNDPDPAIRAFRLGLLGRFRDAVHTVADFSKIEG